MIFSPTTLRCGGRLISLQQPIVMGILNVTPDSFFDGGQHNSRRALLRRADKMLSEGAAILDVGGVSTRPNAAEVGEEEELRRVIPAIQALAKRFPEAIVSVDTYRSRVLREAVAAGASLANDISAGRFDEAMYETVASLGLPYILMHMQGTPQTMQQQPSYEDVTREVLDFFIREVGKLRALGVKDIILDPGFGFGKTVAHNYQLLNNLHVFQMLECPLLAGISRKSMICKVLNVKPEKALNGTTALHIVALQQGAKILRAHDVREGVEVVRLWEVLSHKA